jgi:hypothetical protein
VDALRGSLARSLVVRTTGLTASVLISQLCVHWLPTTQAQRWQVILLADKYDMAALCARCDSELARQVEAGWGSQTPYEKVELMADASRLRLPKLCAACAASLETGLLKVRRSQH